MKLNLLPKHVSSEANGRSWFVAGLLILLLAVVGSALMIGKSGADLSNAQDRNASEMARAQDTKGTYDLADQIMQEPDVMLMARNLMLAQAMQAHCTSYPNLFNMVRRYVPSFYRLSSISAAPIDAKTCTVTMTGTIGSFQHYADVMLALWRIPGAMSVSRSTYNYVGTIVPALTPDDQTGHPIKQGGQNLPDDAVKRLDALISNAKGPSYQNSGNFGGDPTQARGAMPDETLVTIQVTLPFALQTPDPQATLSSAAAASAPAAATGGGAAASGPAGGGGVPSGVEAGGV